MKPKFPIYVLLDRIRSLYNVGSFFRTCDAANIQKLYLSGYSPVPPHKEISKTALGAENSVPFEYTDDPITVLKKLKGEGVSLVAVETGSQAMPYYNYQPVFPLCFIFGNEVTGIADEILKIVDQTILIPMYGLKESLNVTVAGGIILSDVVHKFIETKE